MTDQRLSFLVSATLAILLAMLVVPSAHAQAADGEPDAVVESPDVVIHVEGLACQMCARSLANTLKKVEGIAAVEVVLEEDQRVRLALAPEAQVDEPVLREAVERAGFVMRRVVFIADDSSE